MSKRIYLAGPIHQIEDFRANEALLEELRTREFEVWSPQEAGIASEIAKKTGRDLNEVRREFMKTDLCAMRNCDICLAYLGRAREPSQGMLWEMGWFSAMNKPVIIYNPFHNKFTLMAEFTADFVVDTFTAVVRLLDAM